jgi:RNA-directed DNA polymerase
MNYIPIDKKVLAQWLNAGYVENGFSFPTRKGTPQGGIISPMLANMTLDGLEQVVHASVPRRSRVNFIRYADDFIITGKSKTILEMNVIPAIEQFLSERGLQLSKEKTKISYIRAGFTFLGQTFRKYGNTLHITPSKEGVLALIRKVGTIIRKHVSAPMVIMIKKLNEVLRGWVYYHRHVVSSEAFKYVDNYVYQQLWRMLRKRHSNKSSKWISKKYWTVGKTKSVFAVVAKLKNKIKIYEVIKTSAIGIKRHKKIKADANPYMKEYSRYYWERRHNKDSKYLPGFTSRQMRLALNI